MANELTSNLKVTYTKGGTEVTFPDTVDQSVRVTVAGTLMIQNRQSIATSATALNLGGVATGGICVIVNRDPTNYVSLRSGAGGTDLIVMQPGDPPFIFRISSSTVAPNAIAHSAACEVEFVIFSA